MCSIKHNRHSAFCILHSALTLIVILHSAFFILHSIPAQAQTTRALPPLNPLCFQQSECESAPYNGRPLEAAECRQQNERWVNQGYLYNCLSQAGPFELQVAIGGRTVENIGQYIQRLYTWFAGMVGIVAGLMIIWAGVKWLTSGGIPERITDAKRKIVDALIGMVLVLGSFILLNTINPALVNLRIPETKMARQTTLGAVACIDRPEFPCGSVFECNDPGPGDAYVRNPPCGSIRPEGQCIGQNCGSRTCTTIIENKIMPRPDRRLHSDYIELMAWLLQLTGVRNADQVITRVNLEASDENRSYINTAFRESPIPGALTLPSAALSRQCIDPGQCQCNSLSPSGSTAQDLNKAIKCISSTCNCVLAFIGHPDNPTDLSQPSCQEPLSTTTGQAGITEVECTADEQCASRVCNQAEGVCGPSPSGSSIDCNRNIDCQSGICNREVATAASGEGICQEARSQPPGEECDRNEVCQSERCGSDDECTYLDGREYD